MKVLIVEDDKGLAYTMKSQLEHHYVVDLAFTGESGEYQACVNTYDVIILDLNLPDTTGFKLCKKIREHNQLIPILILTANFEQEDKIMGLNLGADDFMTKPFHFAELQARIRALLRRHTPSHSPTTLRAGPLRIDLITKKVFYGSEEISLRRKEFDVLEYMVRNTGLIVTRSMLLDHVWETDYDGMTNTIDVHIKTLRNLIDKNSASPIIKTVRGIGYRIEVSQASSDPES